MDPDDIDCRLRRSGADPVPAAGTGGAAWLAAAYLPNNGIGITGLPHWFEMACLLVPLIFILLCWAMVRFVFRDIPLEDIDAA